MRINISNLKALSNKEELDIPAKQLSSIIFVGTGRQKIPAWSNRFKKEFNDLEYNIRYSQIKGKGDIMENKMRSTSRTMSSKSLRSSFSELKTSRISATRKQKRIQMMKMNKPKNPEKISISQSTNLPNQNTIGLSLYQFKRTISGRLACRSNSHLQFKNQTERFQNIQKVWYNKDRSIDLEKLKLYQNDRSHNFSSYTPRKVFEPREELDKFYDIDKGLKLIAPQPLKNATKIDRVKGRKQIKPQSGPKLTYNEYESRKKIMNKVFSFPIGNMKRELQFTRQIISPSRGCYR